MPAAAVYLINDHADYLNMATNSIAMLRKFNKNIKVLCLVVDGKVSFPDELNVEVVSVENLDKNYFPSNKEHLKNISYDPFLYIDSDTFIFDDIEKIFNLYPQSFVGCENKWAYGKRFDLFKPFNSGVVLFRGSSNKIVYDNFSVKLNNINDDHPKLCEWLNKYNPWTKEEFLMSQIVENSTTEKTFFERNHVKITENVYDFININSIIFHTYTNNWGKLRVNNFKGSKLRPKLA